MPCSYMYLRRQRPILGRCHHKRYQRLTKDLHNRVMMSLSTKLNCFEHFGMDIMNGNGQKPLVRDKFCINNTSVKTKQATGLGHRINASEINIKGGCETRRKTKQQFLQLEGGAEVRRRFSICH